VGILVLTLLKNPEPRNQQNFRDYLIATWGYLRNIKLLGLLAASVVTFILLYGAILTYFTLLLDERFQASSFIIGLIMTAMSLATAAVSAQLGRINRIFSLTTIIIFAFVLYGISFILVPLMPGLWLLLVPVVIFGAGHGGNIPSLQTAVAGLTPLEYRAAFMSVNAMVLRLGQTVGPPLLTLVYLSKGFDVTFYFSGLIALVTAAVAFLYPRIGRQHHA